MSSAKQTLGTRLVMAGAFVGALLALSLSWTFSWGSAAGKPTEEHTTKAAFHAKPGQCLTWKQQHPEDAHVVPCKKPHLFEVTSVLNLGKQFPRGAQPPDMDKWRDIADNKCAKQVEDYLDEPLDPHGRYSVTVLRPTSSDWKQGMRKVRCGLQRTAPAGKMLKTTGQAAEQPQSSVFEAGTCLDLVGKSVGAPVDCDTKHSYEIIATIDLTEKFSFTDGYPDKEDQQAWLDKQCNKSLKTYTGGADISDKGLLLGWDTVKEKSWKAGSTKVNCKVAKTLEDGSGLAPSTGSISKKADDDKRTDDKKSKSDKNEGE